MAGSDDAALAARVRDVAAPVAARHAVDLEDVELRGHQGSRKVQVIVHADEGLDIDLVATLSREIGDALDEADVIKGRHTLEVSSPGADRPLRRPRDFQRNVGRQVRVLATREAGGEVTGTLLDADDETIRLEVDGAEMRVPFEDVDHGKVVLPW